MSVILEHWPQVLAAYLVYLVAVLSPGPATMAIAQLMEPQKMPAAMVSP